ncbi:MAG TPA: hypothetical protein VMU39_03700 [Solirubrobacteraceae bacterium]|nr:hypothetical protein [Solirubrobacteraceae bacterium]
MPTIANPHGGRGYETPWTDRQAPAVASSSLTTRVRAIVRRGDITAALARGVDPSTRPELARRATQLVSARNRRALARSLRGAIGETHNPPMARGRVVIVRRGAVLEAEAAIARLIDRLTSPAPVGAQGMAMLERMLTNADDSPLYNPAQPGRLRDRIEAATAALDPRPADSHEFPISS